MENPENELTRNGVNELKRSYLSQCIISLLFTDLSVEFYHRFVIMSNCW